MKMRNTTGISFARSGGFYLLLQYFCNVMLADSTEAAATSSTEDISKIVYISCPPKNPREPKVTPSLEQPDTQKRYPQEFSAVHYIK